MFISQTLIVRDAAGDIIDIVEIDTRAEIEITRGDVRAILATHKHARAIERVTTREVLPS
jgi:hypothetical protein